jgi:tight adherence protein B
MNIMLLIGGGVILLVLLIIGVVVAVTSERSLVEERLGRYLDDEKQQEAEKEAGRSAATDWLNRRVAGSSMGDRVSRELARADLKFKVAEYFALVFMSTFVTAVLAYLIQPFASALIGGIIGFSCLAFM